MSEKKDDQTPPGASPNGLKNWFDAFEAPRISARQAQMVAGLVSVVAVIEGVAILSMLPLKERVPYFVEVEAATGRVQASERTTSAFKAEERHIRFFMNQWILNLLTIDGRTREFLLPASFAFVRGEAVAKWSRFIDTEDRTIKRIIENPSLRREAKVISISFVSDGVALLRVSLQESGVAKPKIKAMTVFYSIVPPDTDEKIIANPIGFYVTNFTMNDELVQ